MPVYLDNNATTSISTEVLDAMMPFFTERYQNVASAAGEIGGLRRALGEARSRVASLLELSDPAECAFTSGATEANNWAIEGIVRQLGGHGHFITTAIEHPSVLEAAHRIEQDFAWSISVVKPNADGVIPVQAVIEAIQPATRLVSVMLANNETGIIQPVGSIARAVKSIAPAAVFHSDITQAVGKVAISASRDLDAVDLLAFSAHKFHGPKGVGALVIREGTNIAPLLVGGGQEGGRRSGTINLPGVVGCGFAARNAGECESHARRIESLRDGFEQRLLSQLPNAFIVGRDQHRLPNTSCFGLPGYEGSSLADKLALMDIWVGTGSACSSGALRPPHSLLAMGIPYALASSTLRVSLSKYSSESDIDRLLNAMLIAVSGASLT